MGTGHPSVAPMNAEARLIRLQCIAITVSLCQRGLCTEL
jgi:hypothetical protein